MNTDEELLVIARRHERVLLDIDSGRLNKDMLSMDFLADEAIRLASDRKVSKANRAFVAQVMLAVWALVTNQNQDALIEKLLEVDRLSKLSR